MADEQPRITAGRLALILDVPERTLQRLLAEAGVATVAGEGYPLNDALKATVHHFKRKAETADQLVAENRVRQSKADADIAEIEAAQKAGVVMFTADAEQLWADWFTTARQVVTGAHYIAQDKRRRLLGELLRADAERNKDAAGE